MVVSQTQRGKGEIEVRQEVPSIVSHHMTARFSACYTFAMCTEVHPTCHLSQVEAGNQWLHTEH